MHAVGLRYRSAADASVIFITEESKRRKNEKRCCLSMLLNRDQGILHKQSEGDIIPAGRQITPILAKVPALAGCCENHDIVRSDCKPIRMWKKKR